ncbi:hypothetical protein B0H63DRAFT_541622 [Podospora didyma]|uniref:Uncharacterized protein n=1 Tax=Podospora didyma TaxID=330526 RepID=A0AAE0NTF7_9PEZI|nr:hypothetical protein B0H63DRAFT_541622 [Podospora didyma]
MATPLALRLGSLEADEPWIIARKTFDILNEYLQLGSETSASTAAIAIDDLNPMKRKARGEEAESPENFLWETWGTFIEIAKQIPCDHANRLSDFLVIVVVDACRHDYRSETQHYTLEQWVKFNAFCARLQSAGVISWYRFACWTLRDALEGPVRLPSTTNDLFEFRVRAAAQWIELAGEALFGLFEVSRVEMEKYLEDRANGVQYEWPGELSPEK